MKSVNVLVASAGFAAAQQLVSDINAISAAASSLNAQVSAFSEASQASAIVDTSNQIVSLIQKGTSDATSGGMISVTDAAALLTPFQSLATIVGAAVDNLVSRKSIATSLTLGNVVEAQLVSQLSAASAFASVVQASLDPAVSSLGASVAGVILSDLSSGSAAFSGLSGPSTLGGAGSGSTTSAVSTVSSSTSGTTSAVSTISSVVPSGTGVISPPANGTAPGTPSTPTPTPSSSLTPSSGAEKMIVGFGGMAAAVFVAMLAL